MHIYVSQYIDVLYRHYCYHFLILISVIKVVAGNIIIVIKYHYSNLMSFGVAHSWKLWRMFLVYLYLLIWGWVWGWWWLGDGVISHFSSDWQIDSGVEASSYRCVLQTETHCGWSQWTFKVHLHVSLAWKLLNCIIQWSSF